MSLKDMLKKILSLIEEYNSDSEYLTSDTDIANKIIDVINQIVMELCRMKKLPEYIEVPVTKGQLLTINDLAVLCGKGVYQIDVIRGVNFVCRGSGTIYKFLESGMAEIDCFVYPQRITENNQENYVFDLPEDLLEIVPYGVAADLLKSDQSAEHGSVYAKRYETMKQQLDPRYMMGSIYCEGGVML